MVYSVHLCLRKQSVDTARGVYSLWHRQVRYKAVYRHPFLFWHIFPAPMTKGEKRQKHNLDMNLTGLLENSPGDTSCLTHWLMPLFLSLLDSEGVPPDTEGLKRPLVSCCPLTDHHVQHICHSSTSPVLQRKDYDPNLHTAEHISHFEGVTSLFIL